MKKFVSIIALLVWAVIMVASINFDASTNFLASVFFTDSSTPDSLKQVYKNAEKGQDKIKILIVPGHDDQAWGTGFHGMREADLTLALGEELYRILEKNPLFEAKISRTETGYDSVLAKYFEEKRGEIQEFMKNQRGLMQKYLNSGDLFSNVIVDHNFAPTEVAHKLYGINKWANENGFDVIVHIHFNDYAGRNKSIAGKYSGFSIYIPEGQYSNAKGSKAIAKAVFERLKKFYPASDLPNENDGVIEDQELIAIGSNNSLDGAGMLIEYSYIYEPLLENKKIRERVISDFALQTYLGIMDFFKKEVGGVGGAFETKFLPYRWGNNLARGMKDDLDVISLQAALMQDNVYPPPGFSKNDCPLSGDFGPCTERAVKIFQEKYGIEATGHVGQKTLEKLGELYGF